MSANVHIPIIYPHERDLNCHAINDDFFALSLSCPEHLTNELKHRGQDTIVQIDAHLTKDQAATLALELLHFALGKEG